MHCSQRELLVGKSKASIKHVFEECLIRRRKRAVTEQQIMSDPPACSTQAYTVTIHFFVPKWIALYQ